MTYGIEARKERWTAALDSDSAPQRLYMFGYVSAPTNRPLPWPTNLHGRIEWAWVKYQQMQHRMERYRDDTIPFLDVYTGTEIFGEALGAKVYRPDGDMPCAIPVIHKAGDVAKIKVPELGSTSLFPLFEIADELQRRAGPNAIFRIPDIQSPMDIAATLWDKTDFYTSLLLEPNAVKDLAAMVRDLLCRFLDEWFACYGRELIAHYPDYYMSEGLTFSEDEVGVVNPEIFEEFFLPELEYLSRRYGPLGMHCCADARHQWPGFLKIPELRVLNMVQPESELRDAYEFFADHTLQMHSWCGDGSPQDWARQMPENARVVLSVPVETEDEAVRLSEPMWRSCGRKD